MPEESLVKAFEILSLDGRRAGAQGALSLVHYCRENDIRLDQCFALEHHGSYLHTFAAITNPGRTALVFLSRPESRRRSSKDDQRLLCELIRHSHHRLDASAIALAQVLLTPEEQCFRPHLEDAGYRKLADLSYLECRIRPGEKGRLRQGKASAAGIWDGLDWPPGSTLAHWSGATASGFREALQASYRDSRDCPGLERFRDIDDIIVGHRGNGEFDPSLWTLVTVNDRPAAVLLLNAFPDGNTVELTYIGVGAEHRRLGLGRTLMELARRQIVRRGYTRLTLAVDEANTPALRLYEQLGMRRTGRRLAMIRPVGPRDWGDDGPDGPIATPAE